MWYVVQTIKGKERMIAAQIKNDVIKDNEETFIIESERMYRIKGEWIKERKPLFPGYVFVATEDPTDFRIRLRSNRKLYMLRILGADKKAEPIRPDEEEFLRQMGGEDHIVCYSEGFCVGDRIVVEKGPLAGKEGIIKKTDRHRRMAIIGVMLMGKETDVHIGLGLVKSTPA